MLDCPEFYRLLIAAGVTGVLFQIGTGAYRPYRFAELGPDKSKLTVEVHDFIVLEQYIKHCHMIISHCGAGILLESLRALGNVQIVAVVNTSLMDNHQAELADELAEQGLIYKAEPQNVL